MCLNSEYEQLNMLLYLKFPLISIYILFGCLVHCPVGTIDPCRRSAQRQMLRRSSLSVSNCGPTHRGRRFSTRIPDFVPLNQSDFKNISTVQRSIEAFPLSKGPKARECGVKTLGRTWLERNPRRNLAIYSLPSSAEDRPPHFGE
jgi:hypothetical protein